MVRTHLVLKFYTNLRTGLQPQTMEVRSLSQGKKPYKRADDDNADGIHQESVIEDDQAYRDMILLDDSANRKDESP